MPKQLRVLLVAKNSSKLELLKEIVGTCLQEISAEVDGASSPDLAKTVLQLHPYHGVIVELASTDCDSEFDFLKFVLREFPHISCAVLGNYVLQEEMETAIHLGAQVLNRPINLSQLKNWALTLTNNQAAAIRSQQGLKVKLKQVREVAESFDPPHLTRSISKVNSTTAKTDVEPSLRSTDGILKYILRLKETQYIPLVSKLSQYLGGNWTIDLIESLAATLSPEKVDFLRRRLSTLEYSRNLPSLDRIYISVRHHVVTPRDKRYLYWKLEYHDAQGRDTDYLLDKSLDFDFFTSLNVEERKKLFFEHLKQEYRNDPEIVSLAENAIEKSASDFPLDSSESSVSPFLSRN